VPLPSLNAAFTALRSAGLRPRRDHPLRRRGWWRLGGPADLFIEVSTAEHLSLVLQQGLPVTVLGNGSNLLVADAGVRGIVVKLGGEFRTTTLVQGPDGAEVVAGAGLGNPVLLKRLEALECSGLGCLAGVPGTVGGAIRMNAGTHLGEIGDRVRQVEVVLDNGQRAILPAADLRFSYRRAHLPPRAIVTRAWLRVENDRTRVEAQRQAVLHHLERRQATQPLEQPSCGSTFKNPPGDAAGRLIDACGLKGTRIGGAQVSEKHANFFINTGDATAADVYALILRTRQVVFEQHGVVLEPEVHAIGDWPPGAWPLPAPTTSGLHRTD